MRISDWSSDVCSSDLNGVLPTWGRRGGFESRRGGGICKVLQARLQPRALPWPLTLRRQGEAGRGLSRLAAKPKAPLPTPPSSEEHTSALQSLRRMSYSDVCSNKIKCILHKPYACFG